MEVCKCVCVCLGVLGLGLGVCVRALTLVRIVLDLELQLSGVGLHSVHMVLQVLLLLFMSVFKLNELLLRDTQTHTETLSY